MKIEQILWAYDGSEESKYGLKYAVYFAELFNSGITGLHINTVGNNKYANYPYFASYIEETAKEVEENYKLRFRCVSDHLSNKGIKFKSRILSGYPDEGIIEFLKNKKNDLVVMGVTGRNLLGKWLIGSTTLKVLKKSQNTILAVKKPKNDKEVYIKKILVPLDIAENSDTSLNTAIEVAEHSKSNITVIYIVNFGVSFHEFPPEVVDKIISGAEDELRKTIEKARKKLTNQSNNIPKIKTKILCGLSPGSKIVDYAKRNKFDLIVMNKHAKNRFTEFFLGSVTDYVIRSANCPVLAMKN